MKSLTLISQTVSMLLHEPGCEPIMGDIGISEDEDSEYLSHFHISFNKNEKSDRVTSENHGSGDNDPVAGANETSESQDLDDYSEAKETHGIRDDVISILSETNIKRFKPKRRVQFLPDDMLVRIKEIPPRSNKSSFDSDSSGSSSGSDSDSDSDSASDSEDTSERDTPSPATQTVSETQFTTMPPLVWNPQPAKGSYLIGKQNTRSSSMVGKITGIHQPTSTSHKAPVKKQKRVVSPGLEKRTKKPLPESNEKEARCKSPQEDSKKQKSVKKKTPLKKDGKASPPPPNKQSKGVAKASISVKLGLTQRRVKSAPTIKVTSTRTVQSPTVSTSLTALPLSSQPPSSSDISMDRVGRAMQSLNMGKLCTIDGFIFPSENIQLPDLRHNYKSEDDFLNINGSRRGSSDDGTMTSPRRDLWNSGNKSSQQLSPASANRKRRYAWQMANGNISNTLHSTPSIRQMWDNHKY